ncbi:VWA domain-containing protein [bacterium]|nr:VWA domain-containing protein [bacterium]MCI0605837.1 VWA domain-containing protein [bacterium]
MNKSKFFLFLISITFFSSVSFSENQKDQTLSPYFFVEGDPAVDQLPLKETRVEIAISGVIADVSVLQIYENEGSRPINARYIFPASTRSAVYGMRMRIGDQLIVAKVKEKEKAKKEFEKAKQTGKSASLLEQNRPNVFSMSVANILPGDRIEIELRYTELLVPTDGVYELVFPTVVGPRYSSQSEAAAPKENQFTHSPYLHERIPPKSAFHLSSTISSGVPIQDLMCASHRISTTWKNPMLAELALNEPDDFQGNRDFILRYRLTGNQIASGLMLYQGKDENFFLYMAQPPARVSVTDHPAREYIFVVDISGSMNGFPLETSKQLLRDLIGGLQPSDRFNMVLFAGSSAALSAKSLPASPENIRQALQLIDSQRGGGGTELLDAMQRAMSIPNEKAVARIIALVTDGYISAEKETFDYIRNHLDQSNVFAFGIGTSVNRYLIEGVAKAGKGETFVVTDPADAEAMAAKFREYIQNPVLTDITVRISNFHTYDVESPKLPDLFAHRPVLLFGKWRGSVTGSIELTGQTGRGGYQTNLNVANVKPQEANRALRYLWARSRISELSDYGSSQPEADRIAKITSLGLTYNLLTQYTSFIAVREIVRNTQEPARDVDQPVPLPKGVTDLAVGTTVMSGSEPELMLLAILLCSVLLIWKIRARYVPNA